MTVNVGVVKVPDERLTQADRAVQAQARGPGRRDLCRPAGAAAVVGRTRAGRDPGRPAGPPAQRRRAAARGPCLRRSRRSPHPARLRRPSGATSSSSTSSSPWPTLASSRSASRSCRHQGHHGTPAEREANDRELEVLERIAPPLREGKPIRDLELTDDDAKRIRGFRFLTEKPVLILLNVGEDDVAQRRRSSPTLPRNTSTASQAPRLCRRGSRWRSASSTRRRPQSSETTLA